MGIFKRRNKSEQAASNDLGGTPASVRLSPNDEFRDGQPDGTPRWSETEAAVALPARPEPASMPLLSDEAAAIVLDNVGITLDYTPESLADVDAVLSNFSAEGSDVWAAPTFMLGAYVGEVMVRTMPGASWGNHEVFGELPVVLTESGRVENPIMKAFKRVEDGEADSVEFFYQGAARQP
ncbi:DUF6278 family protein [Nocardioides jensenii]|uniref:DUF6278 family protein n=1 Tax=Nocardioides jensenii TaxID=1843 RepID=UPI0008366C94|nr:DUF6278 family protein [Nocardioides jensenii]